MELRVWLEGGPQRVVCGVTEATTCQDVVYALAQATAQTGRFALVERSRRAERALAPSDRPLRLLARWGRCASDVHFLLRRCGPPAKGDAPAAATAMLRGGSQQQPPPEVPPRLEGPASRPRRPPPYDEAVTRLASSSSLVLLGESPSKARQPAAEEESELLHVVALQRERLQGLQEELAQRDAARTNFPDLVRGCGTPHQASAPAHATGKEPVAGPSLPLGEVADTTPPPQKEALQTPGSVAPKTSYHRSRSNSNIHVPSARSSSASSEAMDTTQGSPVPSMLDGQWSSLDQ
ncbi:ras association domain-containing protein 8 isoform X2 [Amblyomma americanum]